MQIQVNTDNHIQGRETLSTHVKETVESNLRHFHARITRVEVHLGDENAKKGGSQDKRCMMEARLEGLQPIVVTHLSDNLTQATNGAAKKLKAAIASTLGRLSS